MEQKILSSYEFFTNLSIIKSYVMNQFFIFIMYLTIENYCNIKPVL